MPTSIALFLISSLSVSYSVFPSLPPFLNSNTHFFFPLILSSSIAFSHSLSPLSHPLSFRFTSSLTRSLPLALPLSPVFLSFSLSLFPFPFLIVFVLETIQIPSVMLELQKPGQSAATSEAPGIAARYSANTTTTKPLHESNS